MKWPITVIALVAVLSGCATTYQASGLTGGFTDTRLADNVYRISFEGNGFTTTSQAYEMALLRSAEVMLDKGFPYFSVMDGNSQTSYASISSPSYATTTGTINRYSNTFNARTTFSGGSTTMIPYPTTSNVVMGFLKKPDGAGMIFESRQVFDSLAPKYKK